MGSAWRQMDPAAYEPDPPVRRELWSGSVWVIGPLMLGLVAALSALGSVPRSVVAVLIGVALLVALTHYLKAESWYWQASHLYELKRMSFWTGRAPRVAGVSFEPDFRQLDRHFPDASTVHHLSWDLYRPGQSETSEADRLTWQKSLPALEAVRTSQRLRGTCYRCRWWLWLANDLALLRAPWRPR